MDFAHLHVHNEFSQLDGMGTAVQYAQKASAIGHKYLALTNHGNVDGVIKFQRACLEAGVKPIIGCEPYVVEDICNKRERPGHILTLVKNQTGWQNLCTLLSHANLDGFYYKPRISYEMFLKHCEGLVVSTACLGSFIRKKNGMKFFKRIRRRIKDDLYIEIMPYPIQKQKEFNSELIGIAKNQRVKVIATNDCHYVSRRDYRFQEVLLAMQRKKKWSDPNRFKFDCHGLHLRTATEMKKALKEMDCYHPSYLENTIEIAEKCCDFRIERQPIRLPRVPGISGVAAKEYQFILSKCHKNFKERFGEPIHKHPIYKKRLKRELDLIKEKKFLRYFVIVWELCNWCRESNILIGPGRGSVGGSLVAYLLSITDVDPIQWNLIFERFIAEDRVDYPDIDIDFDMTKRHLIRKHLEDLFGEDRVSAVSSFTRMKSKKIFRDTAKVFEVPEGEINTVAKLIDYDEDDALSAVLENTPEGQNFAKKYPFAIRSAKKLEGQVSNYGKHAAALVVSRDKIATSGRCNLIERDGQTLVNWEKNDTEFMGLMKLDILGLNLLSIMGECINLIEKNRGKKVELNNIPLDEKRILQSISKGNTAGAFQINTWAASNLIRDMGGVDSVLEIATAIALVRPGPMQSGMTDDYIKRKHGHEWEKRHKIWEKITEETFGVVVYQEQLMQIISEMGGLPYSTADKIRKIIGKKRDREEFAPYKKKFVRGCLKRKTMTRKEANRFWKGLQEWARYGFNKAHSVEYALLGYWSIWLKVHYPHEFICASLTHGAKAKKEANIEEAYRLGLNICLPKIGMSKATEWVVRGDTLYAPFNEIKGIGDSKAQNIIDTCSIGPGINKFFKKKKEKKAPKRVEGKLGELIGSCGCYDECFVPTDETQKYFEFRIIQDVETAYKKLFALYEGDLMGSGDLEDAINGNPNLLIGRKNRIVKRRTFKGHKDLSHCEKCALREEASAPVPPSPGKFNIIITGEAPGFEEDRDGEGFVGGSGKILWEELSKYGLKKDMFHITNAAKCYPSKSKKPSSEQLDTCSVYLRKEIQRLRARVILAFGNTNLYIFNKKQSGIMAMSGKTVWNEEYGCYLFFCIHPAAVLHNPNNATTFEHGIKKFSELVKKLL